MKRYTSALRVSHDLGRLSCRPLRLAGIPLLGGHMIPINAGFYYHLGANLYPLTQLQLGQALSDALPLIYEGEKYVRALLGQQEIPVRTAMNSGQDLLLAIEEVKAKVGQATSLEWYDAYKISSHVEKFVTVLLAELLVSDTFYVSQKGGYDTLTLIEDGENFLPPEVRVKLDAASIADFKQGCRCLAFELPTAAGFHFLRTTEAVVRSYYDAVTYDAATQGSRARPTFSNGQPAAMGTFITEAEQHGTCDPKVISTLRQLNSLHRNSLIHPEDVLTMTQAIILFGMIISAISAMADALP